MISTGKTEGVSRLCLLDDDETSLGVNVAELSHFECKLLHSLTNLQNVYHEATELFNCWIYSSVSPVVVLWARVYPDGF